MRVLQQACGKVENLLSLFTCQQPLESSPTMISCPGDGVSLDKEIHGKADVDFLLGQKVESWNSSRIFVLR